MSDPDLLDQIKSNLDHEIVKYAMDFVRAHASSIADFARSISKNVANNVRLKREKTYTDYLSVAGTRASRMKTFLFEDESVSLEKFYVPINLRRVSESKPIKISSTALFGNTSKAIILGTAGSGKSVLMRHLLIDAIRKADKVPVFVELRRLNKKRIPLVKLIVATLNEYGFDQDYSYITKAISKGHFVLLLDGLDEVNHELRDEISDEINGLGYDYPSCRIVVTSRPDSSIRSWDMFKTFNVEPLTLKQACTLVDKLPKYVSTLNKKFISALKGGLYEKHRSFLSNPLLLSMMVLTYEQNADIPNRLSVFYDAAYDALFNKHDAKKYGYKRALKSGLDKLQFQLLFSAFCLYTYDRNSIEFSSTDALGFIKKASKLVNIEVTPQHILDDLMQALCLLIEDGIYITFAHRSFQEYFVARYIDFARGDRSSQLFKRYLDRINFDQALPLLYEMNPPFYEGELVKCLEQIFTSIGVKNNVDKKHYAKFMKSTYDKLIISSPSRSSSVFHNDYGWRVQLIRYVTANLSDTNLRKINHRSLRLLGEIYNQYRKGTGSVKLSFSKVNVKTKWIWQISDTLCVISFEELQNAHSVYLKLKKKNKSTKKALDEIFK